VLALTLQVRPADAAQPGADLGSALPAWSALPFLGILLSIALFPLLAPRFWHHHYPKVAAAWALTLVIPFVAAYGQPAVAEILHMAIVDYVPFIVLIGTLFTIGGGILIRGTLRGSPAVPDVGVASLGARARRSAVSVGVASGAFALSAAVGCPALSVSPDVAAWLGLSEAQPSVATSPRITREFLIGVSYTVGAATDVPFKLSAVSYQLAISRQWTSCEPRAASNGATIAAVERSSTAYVPCNSYVRVIV